MDVVYYFGDDSDDFRPESDSLDAVNLIFDFDASRPDGRGDSSASPPPEPPEE